MTDTLFPYRTPSNARSHGFLPAAGRLIRSSVVVVLLGATSACGPFAHWLPPVGLSDTLAKAKSGVPFRTVSLISMGLTGFPTSEGFFFVSSSFAVEAVKQAYPNLETDLALDFTREQGILAIAPPEATGGYQIEIVAIEDTPSALVVRAVLWEPKPGSLTSQMPTQPMHYVAIARTEKPVTFAPLIKSFSNHRPAQ